MTNIVKDIKRVVTGATKNITCSAPDISAVIDKIGVYDLIEEVLKAHVGDLDLYDVQNQAYEIERLQSVIEELRQDKVELNAIIDERDEKIKRMEQPSSCDCVEQDYEELAAKWEDRFDKLLNLVGKMS